MRCTLLGLCGILAALAGAAPALAGDPPLRIGIPQNFFHDMTPALIRDVTDPFAQVMKETSGLTGTLHVGGTPLAVARELNEDKIQLAVLHGFEFAWARESFPKLEPVMIAVDERHDLRAHVLVRKDSPAKSFADLKGKELAMPRRTKEHCRYFLEQDCRSAGARGTADFFGKVVQAPTVETALDELVRGKYSAAVLDTVGLDFYKELKPGAFARLRVLARSEVFPPWVIACRRGALPDLTLKRLREGLREADRTENGRDMLKTWNITGFAPVPADFAQTMAASRKAFPPPEPSR